MTVPTSVLSACRGRLNLCVELHALQSSTPELPAWSVRWRVCRAAPAQWVSIKSTSQVLRSDLGGRVQKKWFKTTRNNSNSFRVTEKLLACCKEFLCTPHSVTLVTVLWSICPSQSPSTDSCISTKLLTLFKFPQFLPMSWSVPGTHPGCHVTFSCHVSLGFSGL